MAILNRFSGRGAFSQSVATDRNVDVSLEFKRHPVTGDVTAKTGTSAIAQSLRNICLTNPGDVDELPDFGVGVYRLLGENPSPVSILGLKDRIAQQIIRYEPRAEVSNIQVDVNQVDYEVRIRIVYTPVNVETEEDVVITVRRVL